MVMTLVTHLAPNKDGGGAMGESTRDERLQIMLNAEELALIEDWRFKTRMPSRAAAIRELLRRGLDAEGFPLAQRSSKSSDYGVAGNGT